VTKLLSDTFQPKSVVDVGCGTGVWLRAFKRLGVETVLGIDWFDPKSVPLLISPEEYRRLDLTYPFELGQRYDLALCLEVAEHVPESRSESLVNNLTNLSDTIVFSAAIPLQLGFHHVNERWPGHWIEKFARREFSLVDRARFQFWTSAKVEYWYSQNLVVFLDKRSPRYEHLRGALETIPIPPGLPLVHPALYLERSRRLGSPIGRWAVRTVARFPRIWARASRRRSERVKRIMKENGW
jgi:SAM-dependent methyltransferase